MSRYTSKQTVYSSLKKYVPIWKLDTNTMTATYLNVNTQTEGSKTYHADFIRYHLHYSDSHCHDRLRRLVNEGKIIQYLDDMEQKVSGALEAKRQLLSESCTRRRYRKDARFGELLRLHGERSCV